MEARPSPSETDTSSSSRARAAAIAWAPSRRRASTLKSSCRQAKAAPQPDVCHEWPGQPYLRRTPLSSPRRADGQLRHAVKIDAAPSRVPAPRSPADRGAPGPGVAYRPPCSMLPSRRFRARSRRAGSPGGGATRVSGVAATCSNLGPGVLQLIPRRRPHRRRFRARAPPRRAEVLVPPAPPSTEGGAHLPPLRPAGETANGGNRSRRQRWADLALLAGRPRGRLRSLRRQPRLALHPLSPRAHAPTARRCASTARPRCTRSRCKSAALSDEPVAGLELALRLKGELDLDGNRARIAEGEVDLGAIRLVLRGEYDRSWRRSSPARHVRHAAHRVPVDARLHARAVSSPGSMACASRARTRSAGVSTSTRRTSITGSTSTGTLPTPVASPRRRRTSRSIASAAPFRRTALRSRGPPRCPSRRAPARRIGSRSTAISKFMETAVHTSEDGGFHRHHGFDHEAIRNSIRENLRQRRFVRGASTISMQLAKNLYLDRSKNLARKLQEAVLTMYLEQELTKDQILELYLQRGRVRPARSTASAPPRGTISAPARASSRSGRRSTSRRSCPTPRCSTSARAAPSRRCG